MLEELVEPVAPPTTANGYSRPSPASRQCPHAGVRTANRSIVRYSLAIDTLILTPHLKVPVGLVNNPKQRRVESQLPVSILWCPS